MKKLTVLLSMVLIASVALFAGGEGEKSTSGEKTFVPTRNIEWYVTSSPGGGSDIFTRVIMDIAVAENLLNKQNVVVQYKTDGGGEVGRLHVSQIRAGVQADHSLLTFNSGDLMP